MKILFAYDGSDNCGIVFEDVVRAGLPEDAEAVVLTVVDRDDRLEPVATTLEAASEVARKGTALVVKRFPRWKSFPEALDGIPAASILQWVHDFEPDLLVAGTHGKSPLRRLFLGSVSLSLAERAECSVRIVRPGFAVRTGPIRLVLGTDGSPQAQAAVHEIATRSWPSETEVRVVAALDSQVSLDEQTRATAAGFSAAGGGRERLQVVVEETAEALNRAGLKAAPIVSRDDPSHALLIEAERCHADTIFVGARGLGRIANLFLGSVSSRVVRHAHCTVEIVRSQRQPGPVA